MSGFLLTFPAMAAFSATLLESIIRADFGGGDATKHFFSEKEGFSLKRREAIQ